MIFCFVETLYTATSSSEEIDNEPFENTPFWLRFVAFYLLSNANRLCDVLRNVR